jgi:hypothetical protein
MKKILFRLIALASFAGAGALIYLNRVRLAAVNWSSLAVWGARALPVLLVVTGLYLLARSRHID